MQKRCALIFNPTAGKGKAAKLRPHMEQLLAGAGFAIDYQTTNNHGHATHLAFQACEQGYDYVVAAGGDGTINEAINGMMEFRKTKAGTAGATPLPVLGIIPIGRGNDFAYGTGIPSGLEAACDNLIKNRQEPLDIGCIKGGYYPEGRFFGNGIGIGFDTIVGLKAAEKKQLQGAITYLSGAIETMISYPAAPLVRLRFDDRIVETRSHQISILNGRRMGGMFHMAPFGDKHDGLLDLCMANQPLSRKQMLGLILRYLKGTQHLSPTIDTARSAAFAISAPEGGLVCHADGETICIDGTELLVECIPNALRIICDPELPRALPVAAGRTAPEQTQTHVADIA